MHVSHTTPDVTNIIEGESHGGTTTVIISRNGRGEGTRLHRHPYDETWVIQHGRVRFEAGEAVLHTGAGDVVNVPAGTPHKFTNEGAEACELVCIHPNPTIVEEFLE